MKKINLNLNKIMQIVFGTMIYSMTIVWFAKPNDIVNGGASGIAIIICSIIKTLTNQEISLSLLSFLINLPIFIFALIVKGKKFVANAIFGTFMLIFWLAVFDKIPPIFKIKNDLFLATVITGILCGVGTGIVVKVGSSSGGTDMLANSLNKLFPRFSIALIILVVDSLIVLFGFLNFGSTKTAYSIITIAITSKVINNILGGLRFARAVFIVSEKTEEISKEIFEELKRGNTSIPCTGMYTKKAKNILIIVVKPKEIIKLKKIIEQKDKNAFVIITPAQEVLGNGF